MPKLTDIPKFSIDKSLGEVLPDIFLLFYNDLNSNLKKLHKRYTTDNLHDARVSARRMESLFIGYESILKQGLKKKSPAVFDNILETNKRIIKMFGKPREIQVLFDIVQEYSKKSKSDKLAAKLFYSDLRIKKVKSIKGLYSSKEFSKSLETAGKIQEYIKKYISGNLPSTVIFRSFRKHYKELIDILKFSLFSNLSDIESLDSEILHNVRIQTKPLRYLLDMCAGLLDDDLNNFRNLIKILVEKIGAYHDIDVVQKKAFRHFINFKKTQTESANQFVNYLNFLEEQKITRKVEIVSIAKKLIASN